MDGAKSVETNHALICNAAMPPQCKTDQDAARVPSVVNFAAGHLLHPLFCPASSAAAFMSLHVDICGRTHRQSRSSIVLTRNMSPEIRRWIPLAPSIVFPAGLLAAPAASCLISICAPGALTAALCLLVLIAQVRYAAINRTAWWQLRRLLATLPASHAAACI